MTQAQILASNASKSDKMRQLFALGFSRSQVAEMLGVGYGFVQNVYAKWIGGRILNPTAPSFTLPAFARRFGVEIEAFGVNGLTLAQALRTEGLQAYHYSETRVAGGWKVGTDGSITGASSFELVSPVLEGESGLEQLEKACRVLSRLRAKVNKSCGVHVHFEARTFSLASWKNLLANYIKLEGVIDTMMPASRRGSSNTYCRTIVPYATLLEQARTVQELHNVLPNRYHKVNTKSFSEHGTVEFRQHSGSVEYTKLSNWILFLHGLVSYSEQGFRAAEPNFEATERFTTNEVSTFYFNRINDLAA